MFDGLRKKISDAIKGFSKEEKQEIEEERAEGAASSEETAKPYGASEPMHEAAKPEISKEEGQVAKNKKEEKNSDKYIELGITTKIKSKFTSSVSLSHDEIDDFADTLEKSMLESDVSYETATHLSSMLKAELSSRKFSSHNIEKDMLDSVKSVLTRSLSETKGIDVLEFVKERISNGEKPVKILFLGPNGTGKTTTIAKLAYMFKSNGISCVMAASDTFRAAAIEQTEFHANKIGVPVIKSTYGADPASIAFDAIAYAKAHGTDIVLIDSAGRQETNKNLLKEMEKMVRVAKPNITIYVGESISGNAIAKQIKEFSNTVKIDGIILTKLDCDAKGGGAVSISYITGIPILFFGTGEDYSALVKYSPQFVVNSILPNA